MSDIEKAKKAIAKNLFSTLDSQMGKVFTASQSKEIADQLEQLIRVVIADERGDHKQARYND